MHNNRIKVKEGYAAETAEAVEFSFSDLGNQKVKNTIIHAFDLMISGLAQREMISNKII